MYICVFEGAGAWLVTEAKQIDWLTGNVVRLEGLLAIRTSFKVQTEHVDCQEAAAGLLNYSTPCVYISSIGHLRLHDLCKQDASLSANKSGVLFALIMKRKVLLTCQLMFSRRYPLCLFSSAVSTPPSLGDPVRQFFFHPAVSVRVTEHMCGLFLLG